MNHNGSREPAAAMYEVGELVPFALGLSAIALAAREREHYLLFMPDAPLCDWPPLLDLGEYVLLLDRGDETFLFRCESRLWPVMQRLCGPYRLHGVVIIPKTTPRNLVYAAINVAPPEQDKDIIVAQFPEHVAANRVAMQPLLLAAIHAVDPDSAAEIAKSTGP